MSITLSSLGIVWLGAFIGALAAGGAGFAFALVASSIWLHIFDPPHTTALIVATGTILQIALVWPVWPHIRIDSLAPYLFGAVLGVPIGAAVLLRGGATSIKVVLGALLLVYGIYALLARGPPHIKAGGKPADAAIGLVGGVLGGLAGYSGVLPIIWTQCRGLSKEAMRGICQPFILGAHILTLICIGTAGIDPSTVLLTVWSLPALAGGAWLGWRIYGRLDERRFRQALAILIALSGLTLVM